VESTNVGREITYSKIEREILPRLLESHVSKVTLTGGEPLYHQDFLKIIELLCDNNIELSICTNGSLLNEELIAAFLELGKIHFNVSLDGLFYESHSKFRGRMSKETFESIIANIVSLGEKKLLKGILTTPNNYAPIEEYVQLCAFAHNIGARYLLMNPLSPFGRGIKVQSLAYSREDMTALRQATLKFNDEDFEVVYIRFPADDLTLGECPLGSIPYIFANGDIAICPYMVFAAENENSQYDRQQFLVGNVYDDTNIKNAIEAYRLPLCADEIDPLQSNELLYANGCLAMKIACNHRLTEEDLL